MSSPPTQSISIKTAARKLPIKRKSPEISSLTNPNPNNFISKFESDDDDGGSLDDIKPPPFKFHRIWVESDEIRFLQGLLDSSSQGLIFPRDLNLFYDTFSTTMSQPYTKSQLSEKIRRLRRKFRGITGRIVNGFDYTRLSEHDKSLFEISKKLWDPEYALDSPFSSAKKKNSNCNRVSVEVSFNPDFTPERSNASVPIPVRIEQETCEEEHEDEDDCEVENIDKCEVEELKLEKDGGKGNEEAKRIVMMTVMDVFDKSLNEVRMEIAERDLSCHDSGSLEVGKEDDLVKRCREQTIAELDVVARRIRLVLENRICDQ
ncbi:hypothetical protein ACHQM5_005445 [Ranunculus cassubicifolius]